MVGRLTNAHACLPNQCIVYHQHVIVRTFHQSKCDPTPLIDQTRHRSMPCLSLTPSVIHSPRRALHICTSILPLLVRCLIPISGACVESCRIKCCCGDAGLGFGPLVLTTSSVAMCGRQITGQTTPPPTPQFTRNLSTQFPTTTIRQDPESIMPRQSRRDGPGQGGRQLAVAVAAVVALVLVGQAAGFGLYHKQQQQLCGGRCVSLSHRSVSG